jgi:hypothetical protein
MKYTIQVALLGEGTDVWRPVAAELVQGDLYRIIESQPDTEKWAFQAGETVRCRERMFASGETGLVAYERGSPP